MKELPKVAGLDDAIFLAAKYHRGQFDKGGHPYILHPLKVMHYTRSDDPEIQMIAVMHDLVEDTEVTLEYLEFMGFSQRVLDGVDALTKRDGESYADYCERIVVNMDAVIVKMADLRHNTDIRRLKGITQKDTARMQKYHAFYMRLKAIRELEACRK